MQRFQLVVVFTAYRRGMFFVVVLLMLLLLLFLLRVEVVGGVVGEGKSIYACDIGHLNDSMIQALTSFDNR